MYLGSLWDWYAGLGTQTLATKKDLSLLCSIAFQQKLCWSDDQWFHNV